MRVAPGLTPAVGPLARLAVAILRLAECAGAGASRDLDPLAPRELAIILAVEIPAPSAARGGRRGDLRWSTFLRLLAQGVIACDFVVVVTAPLRLLYVSMVIEHGSPRLIHYNVTAHPTSAWTLQQLREATGFENRYQYLLQDRDSIFAEPLDESITRLGLRVLKSTSRAPTANSIGERVIGTIRREYLDWPIPLS